MVKVPFFRSFVNVPQLPLKEETTAIGDTWVDDTSPSLVPAHYMSAYSLAHAYERIQNLNIDPFQKLYSRFKGIVLPTHTKEDIDKASVHIGYKRFSFERKSGLEGGWGTPWYSSELVAECGKDRLKAKAHRVLGSCSCGIYSWKYIPQTIRKMPSIATETPTVIAEVVNYGLVSVHTEGYISEITRITKVWIILEENDPVLDFYFATLLPDVTVEYMNFNEYYKFIEQHIEELEDAHTLRS